MKIFSITYKKEISPSLERDFLVLCGVILLILFAFSGIIAVQTKQTQQDLKKKDLQATLRTIESSLSTSFANTSEFAQYIGNEVLNAYNGRPESAAHLFKHDFAVDNKLNNFYSWTQLSWVNAENNIVIAPVGILQKSQQPHRYPLNAARKKTWSLQIGEWSTRDDYVYLPVAMGISSDDGKYIGAIISDILAEKLQRDIHKIMGKTYNNYRVIIWDGTFQILINSNTKEERFIAPDRVLTALRTKKGHLPAFIDAANTIFHRYAWNGNIFYIAVTHGSQLTSVEEFWHAFLPHIYLAGTLTLAFLILIYIFRKTTILPAINKLKINLIEEREARKEKDRFLEQILGGITGFIYRHRLQGNHIITDYVSEGCARLTGYSPAQYFGKNRIEHSDVIHPDYQKEVIENITLSIAQGKPFELSYPIITADGLLKWVLNQGHPIAHSDDFFEGLLTDITEMKNTEKRMEETLKALKVSNSELEEFAYACSHDLKEPLRTIFSYIQLYKWEKNPEYLGYIEASSLRMKYLIENILLYSKLGISAPVEQEVTPITHIINHVEQIMHGTITDSAAKIVVHPTGSVIGDREQFYRLFQNLLSNALKFRNTDSPYIEIGGSLEGGMWKLYIKDNGIGIAPEFHNKIFNLFGRLHSQDQYQGSGIGLTLCKRIVERHGGKLWLESLPDQGATFFFTLPAST